MMFHRDMCKLTVSCLLFSAVAVLSSARAGDENWARYRGENGTGISAQKGIPTTWSPGDFAWNIEIPGVGHSSPVIWGDNLFVTSAVDEGAARILFCLDAETGDEKWSRTIGMNKSHKHNKSSWASGTPLTDGEMVYVAFADKESYLLAAYSIDGELLWRRNLGTFESQHGQGVSPILYEDMVIIPNDQMGPSSIVAVDRLTGQTRWSVLRSVRKTSYSTPMIVQLPGEDPQLICLSGAMGVTSLDPHTGRHNWITGEFPLRTVASPVFGGGVIIASCGGGGIGKLMIAVNPSLKLPANQSRIVWERDRVLPYVPTPVVYEGHLYLWNDNGVVSCADLKTGEYIWTKRVSGNYSGSPICIDGKLYCMDEAGEVVVVAASPEYKLYGRTPLGDPSHSTPAVAQGRLYLRTFHRLACLEAQMEGK